MLHLKVNVLMKRNIDALLKRRGFSRRDLARYLRHTNDKKADTWLSHIMKETSVRELPLKYWDRAADYLGVSTYQLLQPGIGGAATERRCGMDRRKGIERRVGASLPERPGDVDVMQIIRVLSRPGREKAVGELMKILDQELRRQPTTPASPVGRDQTSETTAASRAPKRGRGTKPA